MVDSTAKVTRFPDRETGVFFCSEVLARTWFEPSVSIHGIQGGWSQSGVTCMIPLEVVPCSLDLPCCMACFSGLTSALSFDFVVLVPAMRLCPYACISESLFVFCCQVTAKIGLRLPPGMSPEEVRHNTPQHAHKQQHWHPHTWFKITNSIICQQSSCILIPNFSTFARLRAK